MGSHGFYKTVPHKILFYAIWILPGWEGGMIKGKVYGIVEAGKSFYTIKEGGTFLKENFKRLKFKHYSHGI